MAEPVSLCLLQSVNTTTKIMLIFLLYHLQLLSPRGRFSKGDALYNYVLYKLKSDEGDVDDDNDDDGDSDDADDEVKLCWPEHFKVKRIRNLSLPR